jgi:hypothetical protein
MTVFLDSEMHPLSSKDSGVDLAVKTDSETASNVIKELSLENTLEQTHRRTHTSNSSLGQEENVALSPQNIAEPTETLPKPLNVIPPLTETILKALPKALQPPVIAALGGLLITVFVPLRGLFVDLHDRDDDAPLEWLFDGLKLVRSLSRPNSRLVGRFHARLLD